MSIYLLVLSLFMPNWVLANVANNEVNPVNSLSSSLNFSFTEFYKQLRELPWAQVETHILEKWKQVLIESKHFEQGRCLKVGEQWEMVFKRLEKLSIDQIDQEFKGSSQHLLQSRDCQQVVDILHPLLRSYIIAKKSDPSKAYGLMAHQFAIMVDEGR